MHGRHSATLVLQRTAVLVALCWARLAPAQTAPIRPLAITKFVLPNGLVAILNEDHASPIVAFDLYYHIGSKNDRQGLNGVAHYCEHIMGDGSPHLDRPQSDYLRAVGGTSPHWAATSEDITHYYGVVPRNQLETVLWMEADRMATPLSKADSQHMASERPVITQERLQSFDNLTWGLGRELVSQALFTSDNPYYRNPVTTVAEIQATTIADLKAECLPYYVPNNAVLALSGDFDSKMARAWIAKYFSAIPRGVAPKQPVVPTTMLDSIKRLVLEDSRATQPELHLVWVGAGYANPDRIPLLALASTLSTARFGLDGQYRAIGVAPPAAGRLQSLLIRDRKLATSVIADNVDVEETGYFEIDITPRAGASMTTIETLVDSVMTDLKTHPVTGEELARYNAFNEVQLVTSLETKSARADTLAHDQVFTGDPNAYVAQARRARTLKPADVARMVDKYFSRGHLVVSYVPAGKLNLISKPDLPYANVTPPSALGNRK